MLLQHILRDLMKARGYTQEYVGEKMGCSRQAIGSIINGQKGVTIGRLVELADILDCEIVLRSRTHGHAEWIITDGKSEFRKTPKY